MMLGVVTTRGDDTSIQWVETQIAAEHLTMHRTAPTTKKDPVQPCQGWETLVEANAIDQNVVCVYIYAHIIGGTLMEFKTSFLKVLIVVVIFVQSLCRIQFSATPWTLAHQAPLSSTISQSLLKFTSIELAVLSNHLILCRPLLLLSSIFPSITVFSSESALCIRWPKYWSFSFQWVFRVDFLYIWLLWSPCCPRPPKSILKHHSLKASILCIQPSLCSNSHILTWPLEKPELWLYRPLLAKWCLCFLIHCLGFS